MEWQYPPTAQGMLWWQEFEERYGQWVASRYSDRVALESMERSLCKLFERCPAYAPQIEHVALHLVFFGRRFTWPSEVVIRIAQFGLELILVCPDGSQDEALRAGLLALCLADLQLAANQYFAGLDALRRVQREAERLEEDDPLAIFIKAGQQQLYGGLYELGLEQNRAASAYADAARTIGPLLEHEAALSAFVERWLDVVLGPFQQPGVDTRPLAVEELSAVYVTALLGQTRVEPTEAELDLDQRKDLIHRTQHAVERWRLPLHAKAINLAQTIHRSAKYLSPDEAYAFIDLLLREPVLNRSPTESDAAQALLQAAAAHVYLFHGDSAKGDPLYNSAQQYAERSSTDFVQALVTGWMLVDYYRQSSALVNTLIERFIDAVVTLAKPEHHSLLDAHSKALLEEPLAIVVEHLFQEWTETPNVSSRLWLAAVLDLHRQPSWAGIPTDTLLKASEQRSLAAQSALAALDRLQRIHDALSSHVDTVVIIMHTIGERCLFLCLAGNQSQPIQAFWADSAYGSATRALAQAARDHLDLVSVGGAGFTGDDLQAFGEAAFRAMPSEVQQLIREHTSVLLVPDFRTDEDSVPFEIMHDGVDYLGVSKIVARLTSIWHAVHILEATSIKRRVRQPRAILTSAPIVSGLPDLRFARGEIAAVHDLLKQRLWDAPPIAEERLSSSFLLDRLEYISLLHIAAHGETVAGNEALILPHNERLEADDLLRRRFPGLPFVYLNTCSLGETRYLGGGLSRGIAHSLSEQGAPAVIANLSYVIDKQASAFCREFYRNALQVPIGEALRRTRQQIGTLPVFWGTTILIGDPAYTLQEEETAKSERRADSTLHVLESYAAASMGDQAAQAQYTQAAAEAEDELRRYPEKARLLAAMYLMDSLRNLEQLDESVQLAEMRLAIQAADEIDHLPTATLLRMRTADRLLTDEDLYTKLEALEDLLESLYLLKEQDDQWGPVWAKYRQTKWDLQMEARGQRNIRYGPKQDERTEQALDAMVNLFKAEAISAEDSVGRARLREAEDTLEDVAWNAYVVNYPNRFEDMPETAAFGAILARKLYSRGWLTEEALPYGATILTGLLRLAWDQQDLRLLREDITHAWAATILQAIQDVQRDWSPPLSKPWFEIVRPFPEKVDEMLGCIRSLAWEEVYQHLDAQADQLQQFAQGVLTQVKNDYPTAFGGCAAYIAGTLIEKNSFSPFDGSVSESIIERLVRVYQSVASLMDTSANTYLWQGFESVRNPRIDELQRWRR